jgi:hypothetical protein
MEKWYANLGLIFPTQVSMDDTGEVASEAPGPELLAEQRERIRMALERLTDDPVEAIWAGLEPRIQEQARKLYEERLAQQQQVQALQGWPHEWRWQLEVLLQSPVCLLQGSRPL